MSTGILGGKSTIKGHINLTDNINWNFDINAQQLKLDKLKPELEAILEFSSQHQGTLSNNKINSKTHINSTLKILEHPIQIESYINQKDKEITIDSLTIKSNKNILIADAMFLLGNDPQLRAEVDIDSPNFLDVIKVNAVIKIIKSMRK